VRNDNTGRNGLVDVGKRRQYRLLGEPMTGQVNLARDLYDGGGGFRPRRTAR